MLGRILAFIPVIYLTIPGINLIFMGKWLTVNAFKVDSFQDKFFSHFIPLKSQLPGSLPAELSRKISLAKSEFV
jgi:hypothetical protein